MTTLFTNIAELVTNDPQRGDGSTLGLIRGAALVVEEGHIAWVGESMSAPAADVVVDCDDSAVIPGFVDSHAHLAFVGERSAEFAARMRGESYAAGGIATTVEATRAASRASLDANVSRYATEMLMGGITTFECKSGYGLETTTEAISLQIAGLRTSETTFLGAHVVPAEYRADRDAYVELVTGDMLAACAPHARWVDVFCDAGAFDVDESRAVLEAGMSAGLLPRIHAGQLDYGQGIQLGVELGAASIDHCTYTSAADIEALAAVPGTTVATLLPGAEFSTRAPWPDGARLIDAGVTVAIATDFNPGSSFTSSMAFCIAVAVRDMGLSPAQALWAATAGGAAALRRDDIGVVKAGARADLVVLNAPSYIHLAYRPGVPLVRDVVRAGRSVGRRSRL